MDLQGPPLVNRWLRAALLLLAVLMLSQATLPFDRLGIEFPQCSDLDEQLPRALLIGDSTQIRYYPMVKKMLGGRVNVCRIVELAPQRIHSLVIGGPLVQPVNAKSTANGIRRLDEWLNGTQWDVIHYNFGIHDLHASGDRSVIPATLEKEVLAYKGALAEGVHFTDAGNELLASSVASSILTAFERPGGPGSHAE